MRVTTQIEVAGPTYPYTEEQAAAQVLAALGGNPANDTSEAMITHHALRITANIAVEADDALQYTPDQAATQILAALAGNPTTDYCVAVVLMQTSQGEAGVPPS